MTPAVKTHLSVLLGVLALIKAVDYYFQRLELVLSRDHVVNGATATSVHANKPALTLLIAIAVIAAGLFLYNIRQKGWTLPDRRGGPVDPGVHPRRRASTRPLYQALRVSPSELTRETPYIQRNITATRAAYGLNNVQVDRRPTSNTPTVTDRADPGQLAPGPGQPADARQRPAARPRRPAQEHLRQVPGPALLLRVQRPGPRPLPAARPAAPRRQTRRRPRSPRCGSSTRRCRPGSSTSTSSTPTATARCWPRSVRTGSTPTAPPTSAFATCRRPAHRPCEAESGLPDLLRRSAPTPAAT